MLSPGTYLQQRYRIVRPLGNGGMGRVYEAWDDAVDCTVAIKEMLVATEELQRAFRREAKLLANLRHPALPRVTHCFQEESGLFIAMDFVDGISLDQLVVNRGGPLTIAEAQTIAEQLLDAVEYLHSLPTPVIHRDIKPANIKVTDKREFFLLDFGLAKGQKTSAGDTSSVYGYSAHYAPLEQITAAGTSIQSDIYSIGATLYYTLTATSPATAGARYSALEEGGSDPLIEAAVVNPRVPPGVSAAIAKAMEMSPRKRFASVATMLQVFREGLQPEKTTPPQTRSTARLVTVEFRESIHGEPREPETVPISKPTDDLPFAESSTFHLAKTYVSQLITRRLLAGDTRFELSMIPERRRISVVLLLISALLAGVLTAGFLAYAFVSTRMPTPRGERSSVYLPSR